jgi:hypothetical protein
MTLEEIIRKRLQEATETVEVVAEQKTEEVKPEETVTEVKKEVELKGDPESKETVVLDPKMKKEKKEVVKEGTVSAQVSALLEAEGLSEEFKTQAVTIFEAAVTDRVLQIQEELKTEFDAQLAEAKEQLNADIDGVLSEAVEKWHKENEVAIQANFKSQKNESFMDGLFKLIAEHSIDISEDQEDALEVALSEVDKLHEAAKSHESELSTLQEEINQLKATAIMESFKEKMTKIEFDRFKQLTESVSFESEEQYAKQLNIVLENFGASKQTVSEQKTEVITESVVPTQVEVKTVDSSVSAYANFIRGKK